MLLAITARRSLTLAAGLVQTDFYCKFLILTAHSMPTAVSAATKADTRNALLLLPTRLRVIVLFILNAGVEHMYVHVVHDNAAAQQLYSSMGYEQETEETEGFARALRRPRRLLLHKQLRS